MDESVTDHGDVRYDLNCTSTTMEPPAPPAPASEELSTGAIGGIVVGAYLGVSLIGGAIVVSGALS